MMNAVFPPRGFGKMLKPPEMMFAGVSTAPFAGIDHACHSFEIREVIEPVIALTYYRGRIVPVIIGVAVGCEVDITLCRSDWTPILIAAV
jgi:hypothetical protein